MNPYTFAGIEKTPNSSVEVVGKKYTKENILGVKFKHYKYQKTTDSVYELTTFIENQCKISWSNKTQSVNYLTSEVVDYFNRKLWIEVKD